MGDANGALLEYVQPLMKALFVDPHDAMWRQETWTVEAARLTASALRGNGISASLSTLLSSH